MRAVDFIRDKLSRQNTPVSNITQWSDRKYGGYGHDNIDISTLENLYKAVRKNGYNIKFVRNPSEDLQLIAVSMFANALQYIIRPTEKVQIAAINKSPFVLYHMDDDHVLNRISNTAINACKRNIIYWLLKSIKESEWKELNLVLDILKKTQDKLART